MFTFTLEVYRLGLNFEMQTLGFKNTAYFMYWSVI